MAARFKQYGRYWIHWLVPLTTKLCSSYALLGVGGKYTPHTQINKYHSNSSSSKSRNAARHERKIKQYDTY
jgi:hypothetical protein